MDDKILIYSLEDDANISKIINLSLSNQGYIVKSFLNYFDFITAFNKQKPSLILLDLMLPEISGEEILRQLRTDYKNDNIQIIIISAKNTIISKVDTLNLGADDYISKPFDILELISRVNAKIRRMTKNIVTIRNISINLSNRTVFVGDKNIKFTNSEFIILSTLFKKKGELVTRDELFQVLWGNETSFETRVIDVHIKEIRKKIGKDNSDIIETVYGIGYRAKNE